MKTRSQEHSDYAGIEYKPAVAHFKPYSIGSYRNPDTTLVFERNLPLTQS
jgi:hypothetical protein